MLCVKDRNGNPREQNAYQHVQRAGFLKKRPQSAVLVSFLERGWSEGLTTEAESISILL